MPLGSVLVILIWMIDSTELFESTKKCCDKCLKRKDKNEGDKRHIIIRAWDDIILIKN